MCVLQAHIESLEGFAADDQVILLSGTPLDDEAVLGNCGVTEQCTLEVTARLLGGGSLSSLSLVGT